MARPNWTSSQRKTTDLKPAPYNPRKATEKDVKDLKSSLDQFNLADPIIINADNTVIGGHFRLRMLQEQGVDEVDVRVPDRQLDQDEERRLNLRLNKNNGQWDFDALGNFDEDLLKEVGFDGAEIDKIFDLNDKKGQDDAPALPEAPTAKIGEVYQLGQHRLMCGDSTNPDHISTLMDGHKADMAFTDPPYNVNYSGRGKDTSTTIENDNMDEASFRAFLDATFNSYRSILKTEAALYCCYASKTHREFEDALNKNGFQVRNQIIWVKLVASMGWGDYRWKHEPLLYCHQEGASLGFYGDRKQYTTWDEEKTDEELLKMVKAMIKHEENGNSTVWRFGRESNYVHPTQKPVDLITRALYNSSQRGELVVDLFGGSGSTLIACEKANRRCYSMEMDPRFVDVIIQRYEEYTGQKAVKLEPVACGA